MRCVFRRSSDLIKKSEGRQSNQRPSLNSLNVADLLDRLDNARCVNQREFFKVCGIGQRHVLVADPQDRRIEVVTGCNLPMLLKLSSAIATSTDLSSLAQLLKFYGQRNVLVASELLKEREQDG